MAAKYHLAGRSARWMFQYSADQLLSLDRSFAGKIDKHLRSANRDEVRNGFFGNDCGNTAVNHLLSHVDNNVVIVSQYVANQLVARHGEGLLKSALALVDKNPVMDGMLMETDFLLRLGKSNPEKKECIELTLSSNQRVNFASGSNKIEYHLSTFGTQDITVHDEDWFIPTVFNNGGFNCVQYRLGKLIFV